MQLGVAEQRCFERGGTVEIDRTPPGPLRLGASDQYGANLLPAQVEGFAPVAARLQTRT
jgi:hypothetical protein